MGCCYNGWAAAIKGAIDHAGRTEREHEREQDELHGKRGCKEGKTGTKAPADNPSGSSRPKALR